GGGGGGGGGGGDGARPVVDPGDGDLRNPQSEAARDPQHLDVEAEVLDALVRKDAPGGVRGEQLEAALRVADAGHHQPTGARVEGAAHHLAPPRLAHLDTRPEKGTGPDRDVVSSRDADSEAP